MVLDRSLSQILKAQRLFTCEVKLVVHSSLRVCAVDGAVANSCSLSGDCDLLIYLSLSYGEIAINDIECFGLNVDP